ncbi:MAG: insulinase family protein [Lachnospiraceae bacterium]|nr:insulinase family protein [Lachnospiraceae bacterium]
MKKIISLILTAAMLLSLGACGSTASSEAPAESAASSEVSSSAETEKENAVKEEAGQPENGEEEKKDAVGLPSGGETVEGFTVQEIREFPLVGATAVLFVHDRTGARLMYIANDDTDRVFDLTFFTRAVDNTGLPHIFEHSTLDGSKKYPSKALFFNLSYQTYNTYMNAMTYPLMTTYPVASLSEEQLLKYADYYTDSCLHPMIMEDEGIFREEAWRYRLPDMESDLTIEGTVYSEMQGAMDLASTANINFLKAAFPGSTIGNESGGLPENIPDMTWESLRSYHDLYYHPSNCMAFLYGKYDDYTAFLRLLDEAFAPYEKREFTFEDPEYEAITEAVSESCAYPVEASSDTVNASSVYYAVMCPGLKDDPEEELVLNTLTDLLVVDASPLMQNLKRALPQGSFATYIELDGPEDLIVFYAQNVNADDAGLFRDTVDASLREIAEKGFAEDLVDSVTASLSLSMKMTAEESGVGVELIQSVASYYASAGDPFGYMEYVDALEKLKDWNAQGFYQTAVSDRLLDSPLTVLSVTYPEAGLREALDAAEAERLAAVKASMTEEELQAIIDETNAEQEEDDASEYVAALQAVTVSSLPEEIRHYEISDRTGADGVRYIDAETEVDGIGSAALFFDASALPEEDIHWFALYTALLGEMDTESHSREELAILMTRWLYNGEIRLSIAEDKESGSLCPRLRAGWTALEEDLGEGYDLLYEILYETDFTDTENLAGLISQNKAALKSEITADPYNIMLYRAFGADKPLYRYYSYFNGLEYYAFLEEAEQLVMSEPDAVVGKLEEIRTYFHNRCGAAALFAGSKEGIAVNAPFAEAFMAKLDEVPLVPAEYAFPPAAMSEGLAVDSTVQYNGLVIGYEEAGLDGFSGDMDAVSAVMQDAYLYPMLRDQYGAYGVFSGFSEDGGIYVVSYRDPNVAETFDVYAGMADFADSLELSQEELDGYILSSYAYYAAPEGPLTGALSAAVDVLAGEDPEEKLAYMKELKALTPEKFRSYAAAYRKLYQEGILFTAGGMSAIEKNADLYETVLNPFGAVDASGIEFDDVPEEYEHYEAVRFVFENRLMLPLGETEFGAEEDATAGDLAGALVAILGDDPADQEAAVEFLAGYEIIPKGLAADTALTGKDAEIIMTAFAAAVGEEHAAAGEAGDDVLSRGELAESLMAYCDEIL